MRQRPDYGVKERRGYFRIQTILPATCRKDSHSRPDEGITTNLSLEGVAIETCHPLTQGELVEISIALDSKLILCSTKVIYVERPRGKRYRAGLQFQEISEEDRRLLGEYLGRLMKRRHKGYGRPETRLFQTNGSGKRVSPRSKPGIDGKPAVFFLSDYRIRREKGKSNDRGSENPFKHR